MVACWLAISLLAVLFGSAKEATNNDNEVNDFDNKIVS